ncbi:MarR family winged helix-turn-helix transcriptional regulator [Nonomuraea guangzhouensis]|uniref:MarR family winged helix-turn-helix transcriptional regulator n=1 Tax=Nonomuraea guangzhouensis TaxID=1291555 RepID=A0ABW4GQI5_9ACTN|nr:MarR family transcriptional regulator [Nonomuraea guangzhouensis]
MTDRDRDEYYEVWLEILGRTSRPRFVELLLDRAGVTLDADLCRYLVHIDLRGPIGVLELAELAEHNHPKSSRSLARLEQLGLITRASAPHDRRIKTASITAEGHRIVEAINQGRRRILQEVFADWSEHDQTELARLTRRFSDAMATLVDAQDPAPAKTDATNSRAAPRQGS